MAPNVIELHPVLVIVFPGRTLRLGAPIAAWLRSPPRHNVARYVGTLRNQLKIASMRRRVVAISQQHQERGFDYSTTHKLVREVVAGIARTHGSVQRRRAPSVLFLLAVALETIDS